MKKLTLALSVILLLSLLTGCSNIPTTASSTTAPETTAAPTTASPVTMPNIVELESFLVLSGSWHKKSADESLRITKGCGLVPALPGRF